MSRVIHNLIGGRIEPEIRGRIGALRLRATHWIDGIAVGDIVRWNPANDVDSLATFEVLSSYVPRGLNSVYKVELGRVAAEAHVAGEAFQAPSVGHLVLITGDLDGSQVCASAPCVSLEPVPTPCPEGPRRLSSR